VNPYARIAIKIGVVIVVCVILLVGYDMVGHRAFRGLARRTQRELDTERAVAQKINSLLQYSNILPQIRHVQLHDIQTIKNLIPDADEFVLTSYLRRIHGMLSANHLETDGIAIGGAKAAIGGTSFSEAFTSDITALQDDLERIMGAFGMFEKNMGEMSNLLVSYQFYGELATEGENYQAIVGSYLDIKRFTFDVFNMRPHTALVNFQMAPQGVGFGSSRLYSASFTLVTYGDANDPPPLWKAWQGSQRVATSEEDGVEEIS
jgi:hypothetical protein